MITTRWVLLSAAGAAIIASGIAAMLQLDPVSTIAGAAIGGGVGGWIARRQTAQRSEGERES
ncbi:MAG: hypothetical protein QF561_06980 [Phycisphaerales bacterium]|nr:hypothetical protein [Phycisphaerales bacterium]